MQNKLVTKAVDSSIDKVFNLVADEWEKKDDNQAADIVYNYEFFSYKLTSTELHELFTHPKLGKRVFSYPVNGFLYQIADELIGLAIDGGMNQQSFLHLQNKFFEVVRNDIIFDS